MGRQFQEESPSHAQLTRLMWRQRLRTVVPIAVVLIIVVGVLGVFYLDPWRPGERLSGTAVGLHQTQSEDYHPTRLVVELDSGNTVILSGRAPALFEKGRRVLIQEEISQIMGRRRYRFISYQEGD